MELYIGTGNELPVVNQDLTADLGDISLTDLAQSVISFDTQVLL